MAKHAHRQAKPLLGADVVRNELAAQAWCPPDSPRILWRLARHRAITVRYLVAENINAPQRILDHLADDPHPMVRWAARRKQHRIPDRQHIPLQVALSITRLNCVKNACEMVFRYGLLGLFTVVSDGRIMYAGRFRMNNGMSSFRLDRHKLVEVATSRKKRGQQYKDVTVWHLHVSACVMAHRLVYRTFKAFTPFGYDVHHVDGNGRNNRPDNLQLFSRSQHMRVHITGRKPTNRRPIPPQIIEKIRKLFAKGLTATEVAKEMGMRVWVVRRAREEGGFYRDMRRRAEPSTDENPRNRRVRRQQLTGANQWQCVPQDQAE